MIKIALSTKNNRKCNKGRVLLMIGEQFYHLTLMEARLMLSKLKLYKKMGHI